MERAGRDDQRSRAMGMLRRGLLATAVAGVGVGAVLAVRHGAAAVEMVRDHPYFRVAAIEIRGSGELISEAEVREQLGVARGASVWTASPRLLEARLEAHPMVAAASVRRVFPDTLQVRILERRPAAITVLDDLYYLDRDGESFGPLGPQHDRDYPVFTGIADGADPAFGVGIASGPTAGGVLSSEMAEIAMSSSVVDLDDPDAVEGVDGQRRWALRRALQLLRRWDRRADGIEVSELHLDPRDGLILHPVQPRVPLYLGWRGWERRLERAERVLGSWHGATDGLAGIDLRYRGQVVVKLRQPQVVRGAGKVSA